MEFLFSFYECFPTFYIIPCLCILKSLLSEPGGQRLISLEPESHLVFAKVLRTCWGMLSTSRQVVYTASLPAWTESQV